MSQRVYIPATLPALAEYVANGEIPWTREVFTALDESEESEYAALMDAAVASSELLGGHGRRVVVVAEVPGPAGPARPGEVVSMSLVVAVHVDTVDGADPDDDLAWFATQEIPDLL